MSLRLELGDCRAVLPTLPAESVQCVVTSPPYWGLRDYGVAGQLGLEATPEEYVARMVEVFRAVRRVLRADGVMFVNLGDSYSGGGGYSPDAPSNQGGNDRNGGRSRLFASERRAAVVGLKPKDLVGMPWRLAFALQVDGWFLRADIVWAKPNPMPESVTDRPTKAHEYVFLLTKSARYFYDADAVREPGEGYGRSARFRGENWTNNHARNNSQARIREGGGANSFDGSGRNLRSVWTIAPEPYPEAHFATFPPELARRCIVAGTSAKGCCAACGAPWVREVDVTYTNAGNGNNNMVRKGAEFAPAGAARPYDVRKLKSVATTGWRRTCAHDAAVVPCTVLDPFAGSGTVGEVAERNGRDAILIELSPAYVELARARTAQRGLFATRDVCAGS